MCEPIIIPHCVERWNFSISSLFVAMTEWPSQKRLTALYVPFTILNNACLRSCFSLRMRDYRKLLISTINYDDFFNCFPRTIRMSYFQSLMLSDDVLQTSQSLYLEGNIWRLIFREYYTFNACFPMFFSSFLSFSFSLKNCKWESKGVKHLNWIIL